MAREPVLSLLVEEGEPVECSPSVEQTVDNKQSLDDIITTATHHLHHVFLITKGMKHLVE